MNVLIIDDDEIFRKFLKSILAKIPDINIIHESPNYIDTSYNYDVIFLDIDLGHNINGIDIAKSILQTNPNTQIIFSTGYREFAVEAFELNATDYILKPYNETKVILALNKARKALLNTKELTIQVNNYFVNVEDIIFVEKIKKKLEFVTKNDLIHTYDTLNNIQKKLPNYFYKSHQSFLINIHKIKQITSDTHWTFLIKFHDTDRTAILSRTNFKELSHLVSSL